MQEWDFMTAALGFGAVPRTMTWTNLAYLAMAPPVRMS